MRAEPEVCEQLEINCIVSRRGIDGKTPLKQGKALEYDWLQFVAIIGEDEQTAERRRQVADNLITWLNSRATAENYGYPHEVKFHEDRTPDELEPCDKVFLDRDVLSMMITAYPDQDASSLTEWDEIMETFWTHPGYGTQFINSYLANAQGPTFNAEAG